MEPYIVDGQEIGEITERFAFGAREALYVADYSEVWRAGSHQDEDLKIAGAMLGHIEKIAGSRDDNSLQLALRLLAEHARMAFWWADLLALGARHPELFAECLFPHAWQHRFLQGMRRFGRSRISSLRLIRFGRANRDRI